MGSLSEIWDERQIQILVLLSFTLQVFLFFTGSIRHRNTNTFLRFSLWIGYLAADSVAVYVLGLLSRLQDAAQTGGRLSEIHPLAFIWAPFLLIHLGGQDTITAFGIEDNNLWFRHFLNLVVQVGLALYVFWKSTVWHNVHVLVTGTFLFLAGMLKYGERTLALKYGTLESLGNFTADDNKLPPEKTVDSSHVEYPDIIRIALNLVVGSRDFFGGRTAQQMVGGHWVALQTFRDEVISSDVSLKLLEVELRLIYDDLYTKALVLRTRTGIIVRCISQVSVIVALVLFFTMSDKQRYSKPDVAITYTLFLGGIFHDVCAAFMMVMSAWTWGWLVARNYRWLAGVSWWLLSSKFGLPEKQTLWSNSMGQYDLFLYFGLYDGKSMSWKQLLMKTIRTVVNFVGVGKRTLFWLSKSLDTMAVTVDKEIMECFSQQVHRYQNNDQQDLVHLSRVVSILDGHFAHDFGRTVLFLHMFTAVHLSKDLSFRASVDMDANPCEGMKSIETTAKLCRKLSNYMLYLFVTHPKMLPANGSTEATLKSSLEMISVDRSNIDGNNARDILVCKATEAFRCKWQIPDIQPCKESIEEIIIIWIRLIIYMAVRSRPQMHAACLARGGELFTIFWLFMVNKQAGGGPWGGTRIELSGSEHNVEFVYPPNA